jgi:hypothetical protein
MEDTKIDRIRTRQEFAALLAISVRTLDRLEKRGELPRRVHGTASSRRPRLNEPGDLAFAVAHEPVCYSPRYQNVDPAPCMYRLRG